MPAFGQSSRDHLATTHKDLQAIFNEVIKVYDCSVYCGHRGKEAQDEAFVANLSKTPWPTSRHNTTPSMAADVAPWPIDWKDTERFYFFAGYVLATADQLLAEGIINHKVRWGGDWDSDKDIRDQRFNDLPHFELIPAGS